MIKENDYVYVKCLVVSAMPLGSIKTSEDPIEPDVVDVIPCQPSGEVIERFRHQPISFLVEDVLEIEYEQRITDFF